MRAHCEKSGDEPSEALVALTQGKLQLPQGMWLANRWAEAEEAIAACQGLIGFDLIDALIPEGSEGAALRTLALETTSATATPKQVLESLLEGLRGPEVPQQSDVIRIMTPHKSKGLTADLVVAAGLIEGLLPGARDLPEAEAELLADEDRRLFYVLMTRTRRGLVLSNGERV